MTFGSSGLSAFHVTAGGCTYLFEPIIFLMIRMNLEDCHFFFVVGSWKMIWIGTFEMISLKLAVVVLEGTNVRSVISRDGVLSLLLPPWVFCFSRLSLAEEEPVRVKMTALWLPLLLTLLADDRVVTTSRSSSLISLIFMNIFISWLKSSISGSLLGSISGYGFTWRFTS